MIYDYDINSAYPYALSLLVKYTETDLRYTQHATSFVRHRPMGMFHVRWNFPEGNYWYPFLYRSHGNVLYPSQGEGWVMSPEVLAVYDQAPEELGKSWSVLDSFYLFNTEGFGDGLTRAPDERLSQAAKMMAKMADYRLTAKRLQKIYEKALKLAMNSSYGKTAQQVGNHTYFNSFVSAWITSVCRGLIWRAIAPVADREVVIATKTDGILSREELPFCEQNLGEHLGSWEKTEATHAQQLMPGVYKVWPVASKPVEHYRGFGKGFEFDEAMRVAMGEREHYPYTLRMYVSRQLAKGVKVLHRDDGSEVPISAYTWTDLPRKFKVSLRSKRQGRISGEGEFSVDREQGYRFFHPRRNLSPGKISDPFKVQFKAADFGSEDRPNPEYGETTVEERLERSLLDSGEEGGMIVYDKS